MSQRPADTKLMEQEWLDQLCQSRPEVALPGYWQTVADNCTRWAEEVSVSPFWAEAKIQLDQWRSEYKQETGADLLSQVGLPSFCGKSAESIKRKLIRHCRSEADYVQKALPKGGPPIPRLGDLVRTRVVCRYIDGVEFLTSKFEHLAYNMQLKPTRRREGRLEGYFAQHLIVDAEVIFRFGGSSELARIVCEVQVASELATRMWEASHPLYEFSREEEKPPEDWQWNANDPRFIANQLGHMIHLADGLLVQLRRATKR